MKTIVIAISCLLTLTSCQAIKGWFVSTESAVEKTLAAESDAVAPDLKKVAPAKK